MPVKQLHIPFYLIHSYIKADHIPTGFKDKFSKNHELLLEFFVDRVNRSIEFIVYCRKQVNSHKILFGQLLHRHLRSILSGPRIAIDLIRKLFIAACDSANEPAEKAFACQFMRCIISRRKSRRTFKDKTIDFLTIILVGGDHMIDMFLQLCLFVYGENFIAVNDG